jgi:hypothetical protein
VQQYPITADQPRGYRTACAAKPARERVGQDTRIATLDGVAYCLHCRSWVTVTAASLCACGAFVVVSPVPPAFVPLHEVKFSAVDAGDSESPHTPEAEQTFDGPAALYSATASTTHLARHVLSNGGAAPTTYVAGPLVRR